MSLVGRFLLTIALSTGCSEVPGAVDVTMVPPPPPADEPSEETSCLTQPERPLVEEQPAGDLRIAVPASFSERSVLRDASGRSVGALLFDAASGVAGFAVLGDSSGARDRIASAGVLTDEQERMLVTWDGNEASATSASFVLTGASAIRVAATLAERIADRGSLSGAPPDGSDRPLRFSLRFTTIERDGDSVVIGAVTSESAEESALLLANDVANGTAVARALDDTAIVCDAKVTPPGDDLIDFVWIVDNSRSMSEEQAAVADAGEQMVGLLSTTQLSWRLALTTTDRLDGAIDAAGMPGFTPSAPNDTAAAASREWAEAVRTLGTEGSGEEQGGEAGIRAIERALPATSTEDPHRLREGASVVLVHLSDEEDFSVKMAAGGEDLLCPENAGKQARIDELMHRHLDLGRDRSIAGLRTYAIHSIRPNRVGADYCDYLRGAGDCTQSQYGRSYVEIAQATGGGTGSLCGDMARTVEEIVRTGAGVASQLELSEAPISSTLDVVIDGTAIPRSQSNGFDYNFDYDRGSGRMHHKIVFYGAARPAPDREVKIRYRAWRHHEAGSCPDPCAEGYECLDGICAPMESPPPEGNYEDWF
jgi:hypothetical protein